MIAIPGDFNTVQLLLQLVQTGKTELVGKLEERKVRELGQLLGMKGWELERFIKEDVNNNYSEEVNWSVADNQANKSNKEALRECLLLSLNNLIKQIKYVEKCLPSMNVKDLQKTMIAPGTMMLKEILLLIV